MKGKSILLGWIFFFSVLPASSQAFDSRAKSDDTTNLSFTFSNYFILLGSDFKQQFTAPFHQTGKEWLRIGYFIAGVAAIAAVADEPVQQFALKIHDSSTSIVKVGNQVTKFGDPYPLYALSLLGTYGFVFKDKKMGTTVLLGTQAYIMAEALDRTIKFLTGRQRPEYYDPKNPEPEPNFHGPSIYVGKDVKGNRLYGSFPSGHTMNAFALATVFALQYKDTKWVPMMTYSIASLVGLSRIIENKHWTSDVIIGATLGYLDARQVVNNYHRYAAKSNARSKGSLSFELGYARGQIIPGVVYTFH